MLRKYYFIFETLIGIALLALLGQFLFNKSGAFAGVHPHPYWIVILLIASRYGTLAGVLAGGLSALSYVFLGSYSGLLNFTGSTFPHDAYLMPFFFMLVGGLIGEIRMMYKKRFARLEDKYEENLSELQDLGLQYATLSESKHELDKKIAFQSSTLLSLFERLNNLEILDPRNIYSKIPDILRDLLNVQCSSIYFIKNNQLRRYIRRGTAQTEGKIPKTVDLNHGMMGEVIRTKKVVTVNQTYSDVDLSRHNELDLIMSAPILRKDESIVGVINIEKIPFFDFTAHTVKVFDMFSHWISVVVDKALQFEQLKDKNIADEITGAFNYLHFQKRLAYEVARAKRFKMPLALLLLEIEKFDQMNAAETKNVLVVLNWIFTNLLREVDIVAKYKGVNTFAVILPGQTVSEAEIVMSRIVTEINNYQLRPFDNSDEVLNMKTGLSSLSLGEGSYETITHSAEGRLTGGRSEQDIYSDLSYLVGKSAGDVKQVQI